MLAYPSPCPPTDLLVSRMLKTKLQENKQYVSVSDLKRDEGRLMRRSQWKKAAAVMTMMDKQKTYPMILICIYMIFSSTQKNVMYTYAGILTFSENIKVHQASLKIGVHQKLVELNQYKPNNN